jgi:hypothetical protein
MYSTREIGTWTLFMDWVILRSDIYPPRPSLGFLAGLRRSRLAALTHLTPALGTETVMDGLWLLAHVVRFFKQKYLRTE